jgi:hypothetical protein
MLPSTRKTTSITVASICASLTAVNEIQANFTSNEDYSLVVGLILGVPISFAIWYGITYGISTLVMKLKTLNITFKK